MSKRDYHVEFTLPGSRAEVFENIIHVSRWWTKNLVGSSLKYGDEFSVKFGDVHESTQRVTEFVENSKLVWTVTNSKLNFISVPDEWTGTTISFELSAESNHTLLRITHYGLHPDVECYQSCAMGWDHFLKDSLYQLLTRGTGMPDAKKAS